MRDVIVSLEKLKKAGQNEFKCKIQEAFRIALTENFGKTDPVPSDKELEEDFNAPDNITYNIICNRRKVGGAIVKINHQTQCNSLELFFIYADCHSSGLGLAA